MNTLRKKATSALLGWIVLMTVSGGCCLWERKTPTPPFGSQSDAVWRRQEIAASASDFVIYQHEFEKNGVHLNTAGEDHLRSIAARLHCGAPLPVIIERSMTHIRPETKYQYPIHPDFDLDKSRRDYIVAELIAMGIPNAEQSTVVAPPLAEGFTAEEAAQAYNQGLMSGERGNGNRNNGRSGSRGSGNNIGVGQSGTIDSFGNVTESDGP